MNKLVFILLFSLSGYSLSSQNVFNNVYNDFSRYRIYSNSNPPYLFHNSEIFSNIIARKSGTYLGSGSTNPDFAVDSFQYSIYLVELNKWGDTIQNLIIDDVPFSRNNAFHLIELEDSSVFLFGSTSSNVYDQNYTDKGLILKFDKDLNQVWSNNFINFGLKTRHNNTIYNSLESSLDMLSYAYSDTVNNEFDVFLSRIDTSGNLIYAHQFGGDDWDFANDFERLDDGTFILSGTTYSNTVGTLGRTDLWVLRVDTLGNVLWERNYGYPGYDEARGRKNLIIKNNEIYIAGGHEKSDGNLVGWLLKLDIQGDTIWTKMFDRGEELELFYGIEQWDEESMILLGGTRNYTFAPSIKPAAWLLRIDNYGDVIWQRVIDMYDNSNSDTYPYDMVLASDGGILLSGYVINNQIQTNGIFHRNDAWFAKTDSCGFTVGAQPQALFTIDSIVGAQVYITNLSEDYCIGNLNIALYNPNTGDTTLLDSLHVYAYSQFTNGADPTQIVYTLPDTGTYVFSLSTYAGDGMDNFSTAVQVSDLSTAILSQESQSNFEISIYPNPTKDYIIVNCSPLPSAMKSETLMNVYTTTGQLVKSYALDPHLYQEKIEMGDLANGVYVLNFTLNGRSVGYERLSVVR